MNKRTVMLSACIAASSFVALNNEVRASIAEFVDTIPQETYEYFDTAWKLPTHIHKNSSVTCVLEKETNNVILVNHFNNETLKLAVTEQYQGHYTGDMNGGYSVNYIADGHSYSSPRCYSQKKAAAPLSLQQEYQMVLVP